MTTSSRTRALLAACAVVALVAAVAFLLWGRAPEPPSPEPVTKDDAGLEAWCAPELTPVRGGGCFAAPAPSKGPSRPLLVYVHGRYSPKTVGEEMTRQSRVAKLATRRGFGVLSMRGVQGECTQKELADTWCWPSNPQNALHGPAFVDRFGPSLAAARSALGGPGPTVLLGFSNGAYFATLIATRALAKFDAIVIAHGGPVQPTRALGGKPPLLLITADDDPSDGEMRELDLELAHEKWPHELVSREGGHALPESDVTYALTFFERALREPLPLAPPLQAPRARRDAGSGPSNATAPRAEDTPESTDESTEDDGGA